MHHPLLYRFEALIEREWIQAGYPFVTRHLRSALSSPAFRGKDNAPSFLLFIDCTWQIMQQFPCSFEFNQGFLIQLVRHSYWSQFGIWDIYKYNVSKSIKSKLCFLGTFLGDNEAERFQMQLSAKTVSLWSHLNRPEVLRSFLNPLYEPNQRVIWPSVAPMSLVNSFWIHLPLSIS